MPKTQTAPEQGQLFEITPERRQEAEASVEAAGRRREKFNTNLRRAVAVHVGRTKKTPSGRNLTRHDMAVWIADALDMGGPGGYCYRPDGQLAEELGSHPSTVNRSRRKLRECGFEAVDRRVRGRGNRIVLGPMLTLVNEMVKASEASTSDHVGQSSSDHSSQSSSDHSSQNTSDQRRRMSSDHVGQSVREDSKRDTSKATHLSREIPLKESLSTQLEREGFEGNLSTQELANVQQPRPLRGGAERSSSNEEEVDSEQDAYANQDDYFAYQDSLHTHSERQPRPKRTKTGKQKKQRSHSDTREHKPPPRRSAPNPDGPPTADEANEMLRQRRNLNGTKQARESLGPRRMPPGGRKQSDPRRQDYDNQNDKLANRLALIWPHLNNKQQQTLGEEVDTLKSPQQTSELDAAEAATKQINSTINNLWETLNLTEHEAVAERASKMMHSHLYKREVADLRNVMRSALPKRTTYN